MTLQIFIIITAAILTCAWAASDYCKICSDHTLCKYPNTTPSDNCREYEFHPITEDEKEEIVYQHNYLRNQVAMGTEFRGGPGPQPSAANMMEMMWDEELAYIAQHWSNQCHGEDHDTCRDVSRFHVGQNMAQEGDMELNFEANHADLIKMWYDEVVYVSNSLVNRYTGKKANANNQVGHYTQLVWATSYLIGCGRAVYKENVDGDIFLMEHFVCNYGPAGNVLTMPVYKQGSPASDCGEGTVSIRFKGLCYNPAYGYKNRSRSELPTQTPKPSGHTWIITSPNYSNNWFPSPPLPNLSTSVQKSAPPIHKVATPYSGHPMASGHRSFETGVKLAQENHITLIIDQPTGPEQPLTFLKLIIGSHAVAKSASEGKVVRIGKNIGVISETFLETGRRMMGKGLTHFDNGESHPVDQSSGHNQSNGQAPLLRSRIYTESPLHQINASGHKSRRNYRKSGKNKLAYTPIAEDH